MMCSRRVSVLLLVVQLAISIYRGAGQPQTRPLFGPAAGRTAFQDFNIDQRHVDSSDEFVHLRHGGDTPETSHECWGKSYHQRICKFYNLLLWNDTFYYVSTEESILEQGVPEIPLSWVHIEFAEKMRFSEDSIARMVTPETLPFNYSTTPKLQIEDAVIWHLTYHDNFGHLLGEHGPTLHNALCSYMGRCQYTLHDRDVHILLPHNEDDMLVVVPPAAKEMLQCFSKYPLRQTDELVFKHRVLVIGTALVGVGPTCRGFPWCRPNYGRSAVPSMQIVKWKERISRCLNLPMRARVRPRHPRILFVKRPLAVGRGFLNLEDMTARAQEIFGSAEVVIESLEGKSLALQAALFSNASLVIQAHGAALGNLIFLPIGASVIDISPVNHEDKHAWVFFMAADFHALRLTPIRIPEQRAVPMLHKLTAYKQWHQLPLDIRSRIIETGTCPSDEEIYFQFSTNVWCKFYWILKHSNLIVDIEQFDTALQTAKTYNSKLSQLQLDSALPFAVSRRFVLE